MRPLDAGPIDKFIERLRKEIGYLIIGVGLRFLPTEDLGTFLSKLKEFCNEDK